MLRDLIAALDALPEKELIAGIVEQDGCFCALGALAHFRGTDLDQGEHGGTDYDFEANRAARRLNIAHQLVQEVVFENDEAGEWRYPHGQHEPPEARWERMRAWAVSKIIDHQAKPEVRNG
ncbi:MULTISPECIES: hypothetical protein [unclassified Xanthomonas]|uniref:hypothetical protein n=1 Tax=unclassified Xanthomonas TaxID=2643310 RepID=UPI0028830C3D|nr:MULTISPECIES: hypothetical protein [unclassified Xanthomonas]